MPEITAGEGELGRLREQWRDLCKVIDLDLALSGRRALREVESRVLTRSHLIERLELTNELEEKESFLREYRETLSDCAQALGVEASGSVLSELFEDAKQRRNQRQALAVQLSRLDNDAPGLQAALEKAEADFRALQEQAHEDDHDVVRLLAIRASGEEAPADGLSEGTRDQLFLALRLAAIDLHLENHLAMALILDDLLMTFDDERVKALLPVLAELREKTQGLIFTHHEHLVDLLGGLDQEGSSDHFSNEIRATIPRCGLVPQKSRSLSYRALARGPSLGAIGIILVVAGYTA